MRQNVLFADVLHKLRVLEELRRLAASATEQNDPPGFPKPVIQRFQGMQARSVDRGHVPKAQNHNGCELRQIHGLLKQLLGRAEEEWTVNAQNADVPRYLLVLEDVRPAILDIFGCNSG